MAMASNHRPTLPVVHPNDLRAWGEPGLELLKHCPHNRISDLAFGSHGLNYPNLGLRAKWRYPSGMSKIKFTRADEVFRGLLKELRTSRNLSQTNLAARLRRPQSYVSKYETGERRLDFVETIAVCQALDVDVVEFTADFLANLNRGRLGRAV
jgi:hypothetical protein